MFVVELPSFHVIMSRVTNDFVLVLSVCLSVCLSLSFSVCLSLSVYLGLCTEKEEMRFLKFYVMHILDTFKSLLLCFLTFGVRRPLLAKEP